MMTEQARDTKWFIRRDMDDVLNLESDYCDAWCEDQVLEQLRQSGCIAKVMRVFNPRTQEKEVEAWISYELTPSTFDIQRIAVSRYFTRLGFATEFIDQLKLKLKPSGRTTITASVPERNPNAQLFFKANGFRCTEINGDVYEFEFHL